MKESRQVEMNSAFFDNRSSARFAESSPHIAHPTLASLWQSVAKRALATAAQVPRLLHVLDLGAGDGFSALPFLEAGALVTAVDSSTVQLERLRQRPAGASNLEIRQQDVEQFLRENHAHYDIVIASSFLHHVKDYLALVENLASIAADTGSQILLFQDPMRYDTVGRASRAFYLLSYAAWRCRQPDAFGGIRRRIRRFHGVYMEDCPEDVVEYHVVRNGVDQNALASLLKERDFDVEIIKYWSHQSRTFQRAGELFGLQNCFGIMAQRCRFPGRPAIRETASKKFEIHRD